MSVSVRCSLLKAQALRQTFKDVDNLIITAEQDVEYRAATCCSLCAEEFTVDDPHGPCVQDHDHFTGMFLGAAQACSWELHTGSTSNRRSPEPPKHS